MADFGSVRPTFELGSVRPTFDYGSVRTTFNYGSVRPMVGYGFVRPTFDYGLVKHTFKLKLYVVNVIKPRLRRTLCFQCLASALSIAKPIPNQGPVLSALRLETKGYCVSYVQYVQ